MKKITYKGVSILHYAETDSTNRIACGLAEAGHLLTVTADRQSGGKGRLGRSFFSPDGGLYMSVVLDPKKLCSTLPVCAAAALAVKESLEMHNIDGLQVKWVNDILKDGKKVCGILTESKSEGSLITKIVVGIGINLIEPNGGFPSDIKDRAGAVGFYGDKLTLAANITCLLSKYISLEKSELLALYRGSMALIGCETEITDFSAGGGKIKGTILGIDDDFRLRFTDSSGNERLIISGEIV